MSFCFSPQPLGKEPDLTATICMTDPRDCCDVFSPPIILGTPNKENNSGKNIFHFLATVIWTLLPGDLKTR